YSGRFGSALTGDDKPLPCAPCVHQRGGHPSMSAGNTPPRPEEGKEDRPKAETDKAQKISDTAEQRSGPGPTGPGRPESKSGPEALGTPAAKPTSPPGAAAAASSAASAAATPAAKP